MTRNSHLLVLTFLGFAGCGVAGSGDKVFSSESLSYDFTYNNCATGKHEFGSHDELCAGLKNEELNHSCAYDMREKFFKDQGCSGSFGSSSSSKPNAVPSEPMSSGPSGQASSPAPTPTPGADEALARNAFAQTSAAGRHEWNFKEAPFRVVIKDARSGVTLDTGSVSCSTSNPLRVIGNYPSVTFDLSSLNCFRARAPLSDALVPLSIIASRLEYHVRHLPVPTEPTQFQMFLDSSDATTGLVDQQASLGSVIHPESLFFDFIGEDSNLYESTRYYFEATISKAPQTLHMKLQTLNDRKDISVEVDTPLI